MDMKIRCKSQSSNVCKQHGGKRGRNGKWSRPEAGQWRVAASQPRTARYPKAGAKQSQKSGQQQTDRRRRNMGGGACGERVTHIAIAAVFCGARRGRDRLSSRRHDKTARGLRRAIVIMGLPFAAGCAGEPDGLRAAAGCRCNPLANRLPQTPEHLFIAYHGRRRRRRF
jgi:hypothetical protein